MAVAVLSVHGTCNRQERPTVSIYNIICKDYSYFVDFYLIYRIINLYYNSMHVFA